MDCHYKAKKLPFKLSCNTCDGKFKKAGIDVYFGTFCQNNCEFCIVQHSDSLNHKIMAWNQKPNVDKILETIRYYVKKHNCTFVHFMGGEPLLFPNELLNCIERLPKEIKQIRLATSLPLNVHKDKDLLFKILSHIDMLTVSIHSANKNMNDKMFRSHNTPEPYDLIKDISEVFPKMKVETNTVVTKNNFKNKSEIDDLVKKLHDSKVTCIRLTEVMECDKLYTELDRLINVKLNAVND